MGTNTEFLVGQRRTHQVQPKFVHQGDNFKGKSVVSPSEETRQRFKAIEDKLRMMESFLPNNVSPPHSHSRSTVPARAPCFNHQYPTVVQPPQSQGFPKQAIQLFNFFYFVAYIRNRKEYFFTGLSKPPPRCWNKVGLT
ncbi:hypothetical protein QL285_004561 [Trifolium repens]|nr:hypothetical protein QL285_004561 [Trifolium repens]